MASSSWGHYKSSGPETRNNKAGVLVHSTIRFHRESCRDTPHDSSTDEDLFHAYRNAYKLAMELHFHTSRTSDKGTLIFIYVNSLFQLWLKKVRFTTVSIRSTSRGHGECDLFIESLQG